MPDDQQFNYQQFNYQLSPPPLLFYLSLLLPSSLPFFHTGRPLSHASTEESSDRSSFVEERQDDFVPPEDDPVLQQTTVVVKAVMELSNKVPLSRPTDYVEFVKVSERGREGMAGERGKIHNC